MVDGIRVRGRSSSCKYCGAYEGTNWGLIADVGSLTPFASIPSIISFPDPIDPVGLVMIFVFQALLTIGLHCVELLANVSRDEDVWRTTSTDAGYNKNYNTLVAAAKSWKTVVLLIFEPLVQ